MRKQSVADLAHELRTPGERAALPDRGRPGRRARREPATSPRCTTEAVRLTRLLDDLSRLADAERPGLLLDEAAVDLGRRGASAAATVRAALRRGGYRVLGVERGRRRSTATPTGSTRSSPTCSPTRCATRSPEVASAARRAGRWRRPSWRSPDTGIGIAPDDLQAHLHALLARRAVALARDRRHRASGSRSSTSSCAPTTVASRSTAKSARAHASAFT